MVLHMLSALEMRAARSAAAQGVSCVRNIFTTTNHGRIIAVDDRGQRVEESREIYKKKRKTKKVKKNLKKLQKRGA
jgi:glucose dehydrogenase